MFIHRILPIIVDKPECVLTFRPCNQPIERREGNSPLPIRGYREGGTFPKQSRPLRPFLPPVFQGQRLGLRWGGWRLAKDCEGGRWLGSPIALGAIPCLRISWHGCPWFVVTVMG
jgi:hypothetical protein